MLDYKSILDSQKVFFQTQETKTFSFRKNQLLKLKDTIKKYEQEVFDALKKDLHKSEFETFASEIGPCYKEISYVLKNLKKWMRPQRVSTSVVNFPSTAKVIPEPYGCALIVSPWNYPFLLAIKPMIAAICAGNTVFLKVSELSFNTSQVIKKIINEAFSENFIFVDDGGIEETTQILKQPFDYLFFTGSPQVGKIMMSAAAKNLTPVTLELGGKSPCIVTPETDLKTAVKRIIWGKFFNAGQTCIAPDYLYIHRDIKEDFIKLAKKTIHDFYSEHIKKSEDYGRIINRRHFYRLSNLLDKNKIVIGGEYDETQLYIEPTIMNDVSWDDKIMQEEIFGPILPILEYENIDEVIKHINDKPKPLAFYVFTHNSKVQNRLLKECSFGGGCINDTLVHLAESELSFGGVGNSGIGQYHGKHSFETFSHNKSVLFRENWYDNPIRYAPFKDKIKFLRLLFK